MFVFKVLKCILRLDDELISILHRTIFHMINKNVNKPLDVALFPYISSSFFYQFWCIINLK